MRRVLIFLPFLLLSSTLILSQVVSIPSVRLHGRSIADLQAGQKALLSNYCRLDYEGARLQENGWSRFKPYTTLHTNPEFTKIVVVTRFDIELPETPSQTIAVRYQTLGLYDEMDGYTANTYGAQVGFHIQERSGELMVTEIDPASPHVSPRAAIAWMTERLADPKTSELEQAHLKEALAQLNHVAQPRPAAQ